MRKCILFLIIVLNASAAISQDRTDLRGDRLIANTGIYLKGSWLDSVQNSLTFLGKTRAFPTSDAVARFVQSKIDSLTIGGGDVAPGEESFISSGGQTNYTTTGTLPSDVKRIFVSRRGVNLQFTKSGNTITIEASIAGDPILIKWY